MTSIYLCQFSFLCYDKSQIGRHNIATTVECAGNRGGIHAATGLSARENRQNDGVRIKSQGDERFR